MFGYSKHVEGPVMKEYKYDPTDSGRQPRALVWFAPPHYSSLMMLHVLVRLTASLNSTCGSSAIERSWPTHCEIPRSACHFTSSRPPLRLVGVSLAGPSGLNYSCWFLPGVGLSKGLVCSRQSVCAVCLPGGLVWGY